MPIFRQNKSAPQQSCAALKIMLHVLLKGFLDLAPPYEGSWLRQSADGEVLFPIKGYTSSRKVLNLTFFEKDAAIPTHLSVPSFQ